jgi:hypothetical protein
VAGENLSAESSALLTLSGYLFAPSVAELNMFPGLPSSDDRGRDSQFSDRSPIARNNFLPQSPNRLLRAWRSGRAAAGLETTNDPDVKADRALPETQSRNAPDPE